MSICYLGVQTLQVGTDVLDAGSKWVHMQESWNDPCGLTNSTTGCYTISQSQIYVHLYNPVQQHGHGFHFNNVRSSQPLIWSGLIDDNPAVCLFLSIILRGCYALFKIMCLYTVNVWTQSFCHKNWVYLTFPFLWLGVTRALSSFSQSPSTVRSHLYIVAPD